MPYPTDAYSVGHGLSIYGGRSKPVTLPAYIAAASVGAVGVVPYSTIGFPGGLNVYSGWVRVGNLFVNPGFYGHQDGYDNGVRSFDVFNPPSSGWETKIAPTPLEQVIECTDYYADGHPSAVHGYHSAVYADSAKTIFLVGRRGSWDDPATPGGSNSYYPHLDAIDVSGSTWAYRPKSYYPDVPAHNGGAVLASNGIIYHASLGLKIDPATGISSGRSGGSGSANRYPQANNPDDAYVLNFTCGDGGEGSTGPVHASMLVGDVLTDLTINPSAALTQLQADNPFGPGLTWCKPRGQWLFYHGGLGRENTVYTVTVNTTAKTVDVGILTLAGAAIPPNQSSPNVNTSSVMNKFTYIDELKTLFICNDVRQGINFVRMA